MNELESKLNKDYIELHELMGTGNLNPNIIEQFSVTKRELEAIECHRARGAILRSKVRWTEEGEKNTSYFLRLEKQNYCNKLITQLKINDDIISDEKQILEEERSFYANLYSNSNTQDRLMLEQSLNKFISSNSIPKLNDAQKQLCEVEISEAEMLKSIKALKSGKSPGTDGLTSEFYKFFWVDIKLFLLASINYGIQNGQLSVEQRM